MDQIENEFSVDQRFRFVLCIGYDASAEGGNDKKDLFHVLFVYEINDVLIFFIKPKKEEPDDDPRGCQQYPIEGGRHIGENEVGAPPE
jgi:hypothetical protein